MILNRFFGCGITLKKLNTTLSLASCNIDKTKLLQAINQQLCLSRCSQEYHTQTDNLKLIQLFNTLSNMCNVQDHYEDALVRGIIESIDYISNDFNGYLKENYLICLALIFLQLSRNREELTAEMVPSIKSNLIRDILTSKDGLKINEHVISPEVIQSTLMHVPVLQCIIEDQTKKDEITMYELLDGYKNLKTNLLFKWRFKNESMPSFSNENLVKKYGYKETLTYGYYLKEGRPNMAAHSLKYAQAKLLGNVSSQRLVSVIKIFISIFTVSDIIEIFLENLKQLYMHILLP